MTTEDKRTGGPADEPERVEDDLFSGSDEVEPYPSVDGWIATRCAFCDRGYGNAVPMPVTIVKGLLVESYDSDECALAAGYAASVRLRAFVEDYGIGRCVVTDEFGWPVDSATFARYCSEPWVSMGSLNPQEDDAFNAVLQFMEARFPGANNPEVVSSPVIQRVLRAFGGTQRETVSGEKEEGTGESRSAQEGSAAVSGADAGPQAQERSNGSDERAH